MVRIREISSATAPILGMSDVISIPLLPYFLNSKGDPTHLSTDCPAVMPVMRCPRRTLGGNSWPVISLSLGLGSKRSRCEGAPDWKR